MNIGIIALAALIPLLIGFIWYHPKTLGKIWVKEAGLTEEQMKNAGPVRIYIMTLVMSFLLALSTPYLVIHQAHVYSVFANTPGANDPTTEIGAYVKNFMDLYGNNFRTFKHGALHGFLTALFTAMPVLGIGALFERKSWKYILVHTGYWALTLGLMGGVICQWN